MLGLNRASTGIHPEPQFRDYFSRIGFGIGAVVDYQLAGPIDLHSQVLLLGKGNTMKDEDFSSDVLWKSSYLEILLLARYTFRQEASVVHPFVVAGPSFGFLRSARFTMEGEADQDDEDAKSFDAGFAIGAGASMPQGNRRLFGEVRYVHGLVDVVEGVSEFSVKNRGVQVLVGVTFAVGKK